MLDSLNLVPVFPREYDPADPAPLLGNFSKLPEDMEVPPHRVVWYASPQGERVVPVLVSLEAQFAIARSFKMTTDEIFEEHASDFDAQLALMLATRPAPRNGVWTIDTSDIVSRH